MEEKNDWGKLVRRLEALMRLKYFPVAVKMLKDRSQLGKVPFLRRPANKVTLCQLIGQVRSFDWTVGAVADDFLFSTCPSILGLCEVPATHKDGSFRSIVWTATKEDGRKMEASIPRISTGNYDAVVLAPLAYNPFEPDMVLIYANPAQMMLLINSLQFSRYEVMEFYCVGESSCSDGIARCFNTGKPSLYIPCYGERRYGHAQDEDLAMALPAGLLQKALHGMEALYRRGVRYPISFAGIETDLAPQFPLSYEKLDEILSKARGKGKPLLVGITGGIACGKTTVSAVLEKLGAPLIDFDLIARQVVEPGSDALAKIVDYFGKQVLEPDGRLDRKAMSKIVFNDLEKRKKLESFTHPPIYDAFFRQVEAITQKNPGAIIQVAVPLLIELNLVYLFDTVVVVHISAEEQAIRLAKRDAISLQEAENILKAQLPIEAKKPYAGFLLDNECDLETTKKRVESLWEELQKLEKPA
ncbi:MAG: dephospho-CoA kinase [Syntrophobacteraceae bacterium]|nr:dephospho-CoA kinase [Syntrophobacteraceae bacterium]